MALNSHTMINAIFLIRPIDVDLMLATGTAFQFNVKLNVFNAPMMIV